MTSSSPYTSVMLLALFLAGCAASGQQQLELAQTQHEQQLKACASKYPDEFKKPVVPRVRCLQQADQKYLATTGRPADDLVSLFQSKVLAASEQYDADKLTAAQYKLAVNQAYAEYQAAKRAELHASIMEETALRQAGAQETQARATEELARRKK